MRELYIFFDKISGQWLFYRAAIVLLFLLLSQVARSQTAPTLTPPANVATNEDTDFEFTGGSTLVVTEPDGDIVTVGVNVTNGIFTLSGLTDLTVNSGANASAAINFSGSLTAVNNALASSTFSPTPNYNGPATVGFLVSDNVDGGGTGGSTSVNVISVNDEPTFTNFSDAATSGDEDTQIEITFSNLTAVGDQNDVDGSVTAFVVQAESSGTLLIGADAGSAIAYSATTNDVIDASNNAYWTPAANANGTGISAFTVIARDNDGATSTSGAVDATVDVNSVNDDPTFGSFSGDITTGDEDTQIEITFANLTAAGDEADVDGTVAGFVVQTVSSGTLLIGADAGSATAYAATTNDLIDASNNAYWTPASNVNGAGIAAFTVIAEDNEGATSTSGAVTAAVNVNSINDVPTFTSFSGDVTTGNEDTQIEITFTNLTTTGNESDVDGTVTGFVVQAVSSGTLLIGADAGSATAYAATTNDVIDASNNAYWTPAASVNGTGIAAFTVIAEDNDGANSTSGAVTAAVNVSSVNDEPTFTSFSGEVTTGNEDTQIEITFTNLTTAGNEADDDGTVTGFVVQSVSSGTLLIGADAGSATAYAATTNDVIDATNNAYWTPASNVNGTGIAAFTVIAEDDGGATSTSGSVAANVNIQPVNDEPTLTLDATFDQASVSDNVANVVNPFIDISSTGDITYGPADEQSVQSVETGGFNTNISSDPNSVLASVSIDDSGNLTYTPNENAAGTATVEVTVQDDGGTANGGDDTSPVATFDIVITDNDAPAIASTIPADGSAAVVSSAANNNRLTIVFNEPVQPTDLADKVLTVYNATDATVLDTVAIKSGHPDLDFSGNPTVVITLDDYTIKGKSYYVNITSGAFEDLNSELDFAGISNTVDWEWDMEATTASGPILLYTIPENNATGVLTTQDIVFVYDEPMRKGANNRYLEIDLEPSFGAGAPTTNQVLQIDPNDNDDADFGLPSNRIVFDLDESPAIITTVATGSLPFSFAENSFYSFQFTQDNAFEDLENNQTLITSKVFFQTVLDGTPPAVELTTPLNTTVDPIATTQLTIEFNENVQVGSGNIDIYLNDGTLLQQIDVTDGSIVSIAAKDFSTDLITIDLAQVNSPDGYELSGNTDYYILIDQGTFADNTGNEFGGFAASTDWFFSTSAEAQAPEIFSVTPPDNAADVGLSPGFTIAFDEPVNKIGVAADKYIYLYYDASNQKADSVDANAVTVSGNEITFASPSTLSGFTDYYINIESGSFFDNSANDFGGLTSKTFWNFKTNDTDDVTNPFQQSELPADGENNLQNISPSFRIQFNEPVEPASGNITLYDASNGNSIAAVWNVQSDVLVSGTLVTFELSDASTQNITELSYSNDYYIQYASTTFTDATGNDVVAISNNSDWNFSTGADLTAPVLISQSPEDDALSVNYASSNIVLDFDETVLTAQGGNEAALYYNDGTSIAIDLSASSAVTGGGDQVTFSLPTLSGETEYYISVDAGFITDAAGNAFSGILPNGTYSFVTGIESTPVPPTATVNSPADLSTGIDLDDSEFVLDFSERVFAGSGSITFTPLTNVGTAEEIVIPINDGSQISGIGTKQLTINPSKEFFNNTQYSIALDNNALTDKSGSAFNQSFSWRFTTRTSTTVTSTAEIVCTNGDYTTVGDIVISETNDDDWKDGANQTLELSLPSQFEFNTAIAALPTITPSGANLIINSRTVTSGKLTIDYSLTSSASNSHSITIEAGTQIKYTGSTAALSESVFRSSGTANQEGNQSYHRQAFINLETRDAPSQLTISAVGDIRELTSEIGGDTENDVLLLTDQFIQNEGGAANVPVIRVFPNGGAASTIRVYNDQLESNEIVSLNGSASYDIDLADLGLNNTGRGVFSFYITEVDAFGCESDAAVYSVAISEITLNPNAISFAETDDNGTTITFEHPAANHTKLFTGNGISNITYNATATSSTVAFIPSAAGTNGGITFHDVNFTLTNNNSGQSATFRRRFRVTPVSTVFTNGFDSDVCVDNTDILLSLTDPDPTDPNPNNIPDFSRLVFYEFKDGARGSNITGDVIISGTSAITGLSTFFYDNTEGNLSNWRINVSNYTGGDGDIDTIQVSMLVLDELTDQETQFAAELLYIYPTPSVTINNLNDYYCEDEEAFIVSATISTIDGSNTVPIANGYELRYSSEDDGVYETQVTANSGSASLDPSGLVNGTGFYQLIYTTPALTSANCTNTVTSTFQVLPEPSVGTITNDLTGIGTQDGSGNYLLEFCDGDIVPNLTSAGDSVTWYDRNLNALPSINGTLSAEDVFGTNLAPGGSQVRLFYSNKSNVGINGSAFDGCESNLTEVTLRAYDIPEAPEMVINDAANEFDLAGNEYSLEYCFGETVNSIDLSPNDVSDARAHYALFDGDQNFIKDFESATFDFVNDPDIAFTGNSGSSTEFYIQIVENDETYDAAPTSDFAGCESALTKFSVNIYNVPQAPIESNFSQGRTDYYLCNGDDLDIIETPRLDTAVYSWYVGDATGITDFTPIAVNAFNDQFITQTELLSAGFSNLNSTASPETYYYYVDQTTNVNATSGYEGCTSATTRVSITVYPDPDGPTFTSSGANTYEVSFCEGEVDANFQFEVTGQDNNTTYRWYRIDSVGNNAIYTQVFESDSGQVTATPVSLQFTNSGQDTLYYLASQVNNINVNGSSFPGCETERADQSLLTVYIYDIPARPATVGNGGLNLYCEEDVIDNGITVTGEGNAGELFRWYRDDGTGEPEMTEFFEGASITNADLGLDGTLGVGENRFWVSQIQSIGDGVNTFDGCESALRLITVYDVPEAPTAVDQDQFICVGDAVPAVRVTGNVGTVNWYDGDGNTLGSGATLDPVNLTNIPQEAGNSTQPGVFQIKATQTTNDDQFNGCESDTTFFSITIHEIPGAPVTTATSNVYQICEGDEIPLLIIENSDQASTTEYTWYNSQGAEVGTGDTLNPLAASIDVSNLVAGQPNNFDFEVEITTNINSAENFFGCTSTRTSVRLRIDGTPDITFQNITDENAYCIEEGEVDFSASGNNSSIGSPTYEFSLFADFSQVGEGLTDNGDGSASLDLDVLHLTKENTIVGGASSTHNIYFRYTDANGCVALDSIQDIRVDPDPDIDFRVSGTSDFTQSGDILEICVDQFDEAVYDLQGILTQGGGELSSGIFTGSDGNGGSGGVSGSTGDGSAIFEPNAARENDINILEVLYDGPSTYNVTYSYTDENGCDNTRSKTVTVNPAPQLEPGVDGSIIENRACLADSIDFAVNVLNMNEQDLNFRWFIRGIEVEDQNSSQIVIRSDDEQYNLTAGRVSVGVLVENTITGCTFEVSESKTIGLEPEPRFSWNNLTVGNNTVFSFSQARQGLLLQDISEIDFEIYRGQSTDSLVYSLRRQNTSDSIGLRMLDNETVIFENGGIYTGRFYIKTRSSCDQEVTRVFNIIPQDKVADSGVGLVYDFNDGFQGWHSDSTNIAVIEESDNTNNPGTLDSRLSSWEVAVPGGPGLDFDPLDGSAWVTNADGPYGDPNGLESENSWVYSPSLDFSSLSKPTLRFNYLSELDPRDGVVVQISIDDGQSWQPLGDYNSATGTSGIGWYNAENISGSPGNFDDDEDRYNLNRVGWNHDSITWQTAIHQLDYVVQSTVGDTLLIPRDKWNNVRFRIALGSRSGEIKEDQNGNLLEGFAFDNFQIYDRDKVVVLESFSSALFSKSIEASQEINERTSQNNGVVWINYFTDLYNDPDGRTEELFLRNQNGPSARVSYYGIEQVPTSVLSGDVRVTRDLAASGNLLLGWNNNDLNRKELEPASFSVDLIQNSSDQTNVNITGRFTSFITSGKLEEISFRFIIVEDYVTGVDIGDYLATDTIHNVMRKILPDPGGYVIQQSLTENQEFEFTVDWDITNIYDASNLSVIAFAQNEITKEIYQAAILPVTGKTFDPNVVTGRKLLSDIKTVIYPNPADENLTIELNEPVGDTYEWMIFDQTGRILLDGKLLKGQRSLNLETSKLANGIHFIRFRNNKDVLKPKKVIILHK